MSCKLRVILDVSEDVFRDIYVDENTSLKDLHKIIAKSFGFRGNEMASFYESDDKWNQGEEIPLEDVSENDETKCMKDVFINDVFKTQNDKLIYVYDFLAMWTFFIEVLKINSSKIDNLPFVKLSVGTVPENPPEKKFTATNNDFLKFEDDIDQEDYSFF